MKGLIYPLMAIAAVAFLTFVAAAMLIGVNNTRRRRAIRAAQWEPQVKITSDGFAEISVALIARWGHHHEVLRTDAHTELVDTEDIIARIEAYTRAQIRAENYNSLTKEGQR